MKHLPLAFTDHGATMAANIFSSPQAVQMSVFVVRAFVKMRGLLTDTRELTKKLANIEKELTARLDCSDRCPRAPAPEPLHSVSGPGLAAWPSPRCRAPSHDTAISEFMKGVMLLLNSPPAPDVTEKEMGFHIGSKPRSRRKE